MTDTPMTSDEARKAASAVEQRVFDPRGTQAVERLAATLRAYADMLDRKAPDGLREAIARHIHLHFGAGNAQKWEATSAKYKTEWRAKADTILALIQPAPAGMASHPDEGTTLVDIHGSGQADVDTSIAPIVTALNNAGIKTVASCSGHGNRPGNIALKDGRELIIAESYEEGRAIDRAFPDIHGNLATPDGMVMVPRELWADVLAALREFDCLEGSAEHSGTPYPNPLALLTKCEALSAAPTPQEQTDE